MPEIRPLMEEEKRGTLHLGFSQEEINKLIYDDSYFYRFTCWVDKLRIGKLRGGFNKKTVFLFFFFLLGGLVYLLFLYDGIVAPTDVRIPSSILYPRSLGVFFFSDWYRLFLIFGVNPLVFSGLARLYVDDIPSFFPTILSKVTSKNYEAVRKKFDQLRKERARKRIPYALALCAVFAMLITVWIWVWEAQRQPSGFYSLSVWSASKLVVLSYHYFVVFVLSYSLFQLRGTFHQFKELLSLITKDSPKHVVDSLQSMVHSFHSPFRKIFSVILTGLFFSAAIKNAVAPILRRDFDANVFAERNVASIFYYLILFAVALTAYLFIKRGVRKCYPIKLRKPEPWALIALVFLAIMAVFYVGIKGAPLLLHASNWQLFYSLLPFTAFTFASSLIASLVAIWIHEKIRNRRS